MPVASRTDGGVVGIQARVADPPLLWVLGAEWEAGRLGCHSRGGRALRSLAHSSRQASRHVTSYQDWTSPVTHYVAKPKMLYFPLLTSLKLIVFLGG